MMAGWRVAISLIAVLVLLAYNVGFVQAGAMKWTEVGLPRAMGVGAIRYLEIVDANTAFAVISSSIESSYLVKTSSGGANWNGAGSLSHTEPNRPVGLSANLGLATTSILVKASPRYATDGTLFVAIAPAVGTASQVYRSTDGGSTFKQIGVDFPATEQIKAIAVSDLYVAGTPDTVIVGTVDPDDNDPGRLYRLRGSAASPSWSPWGARGDFYALAFYPGEFESIIAIAASDDSPGDNAIQEFRIVDTGPTAATSLDAAVTANLAASLAIGLGLTQAATETANSAVLALTDNWAAGASADRELIAYSTGSGGGGLFRRADASTIAAITSGVPAADYTSLAFSGTATSGLALAGYSLGRALKSTNGGLSWVDIAKGPTEGVDGDSGATAVAAKGNLAYIGNGGNRGGLFKSPDRGVTWRDSALYAESFSGEWNAFYFVDDNTAFLLGQDTATGNESVFKTSDGGSTWKRVNRHANATLLAVPPDFATSQTLYLGVSAATISQVLKSSDGGETFTTATDPSDSQTVSAILAVDANIVIVSLTNGKVVRTLDGGVSWSASNSSPSYAMTYLTFSPDGASVAGMAATRDVYRSTDKGNTWGSVSGNVGSAGTGRAVAFSRQFARDSYLYAVVDGGADNSIFRTKVGVEDTWTEIGPTAVIAGYGVASDPRGTLWVSDGATAVQSAWEPAKAVVPWRNVPTSSGGNFSAAGLLQIVGGVSPKVYTVHRAASDKLMVMTDSSAPPALLDPADGSAGVATAGTLTWTEVADVPQYSVQLGLDPALASATTITTANAGVETLQWYNAMLVGSIYYWRVRSDFPLTSQWSPTRKFTVGKSNINPNPLVTEGLASLGGKYTIIWGIDAATQTWQKYEPKAPPYANSMGSLRVGQGYFLRSNAAGTIVYGSNTYQIYPGWNLIGWLGN